MGADDRELHAAGRPAVSQAKRPMHRNKLDLLTLLGFGLILLSFFVRGFGQFLVGQRQALEYAGPIAVFAGGLLVVAATVWTLDRFGVVVLED